MAVGLLELVIAGADAIGLTIDPILPLRTQIFSSSFVFKVFATHDADSDASEG